MAQVPPSVLAVTGARPTTGTLPIGFAHRGAPVNAADENTLHAFERALALGASGLETDIGLTADGVPVLIHAGLSLRPRLRVSRLSRHELPAAVPSLADLYERCGNTFELSLDMAQPRAAEAVVRIAEEHNAGSRLWLTYWRLPELEAWRRRWPDVHLVYPAMPLRRRSAERLIDRLADIGVDALNVHHRFCREGLVGRAHRRDLLLFAWGIRHSRQLEGALARGVDGVYCDDVESMVRLLPAQQQGYDSPDITRAL